MAKNNKLLEELPGEWQEWIVKWPQDLRDHALIIALNAMQNGVGPDKAFDVAKNDPRILMILANIAFHSDDESLQKVREELKEHRKSLGPLWKIAKDTSPEDFKKYMILLIMAKIKSMTQNEPAE